MESTEDRRPEIPRPMKLEVRQRCGFGCVICGDYPFEYHHMTPWSVVKVHEADNLVLLCTKHHTEATGPRPLLPEELVRRANDDPINHRAGVTPPNPLHYVAETVEIHMGSSRILGSGGHDVVAIKMGDTPTLGFRWDGNRYLLWANLADSSGTVQLSIDDNELIHRADPYDVERIGNRLVLRSDRRQIFVELQFDAPNVVRVLRASFWHDGMQVKINADGMTIGERAILRNVTFKGSAGGILVRNRPPTAGTADK
jgi:hypothetical protein